MEVSQKIVDYAIWYYLKYYPSKKALENKLFEKFGPNSEKAKIYGGIGQETVDEILNQKMASIISEEEVARAKIRNYVEKNKNVSYIKLKMFQKKFEKELVLEILEKEFDFENNSLLSESKLRNQILALKQNGKSKNYIRRKFLERKQDKELIEGILEYIFKDGEFENILKEYEKMKQKGFDKQKIFQKLFAKGFSYDDIKQVMKD
ncbi:RecX family transcriptional regulator [Candidatus Gracilibacteria bacterium]|nr:RecX family transcriptional regulator [Candidatus Gracilibacteria bacterium]